MAGLMEDTALSAALAGVHRSSFVTGACVEAEGRAVANHLPFSEAKAKRLCATVHEMCSGYTSVGRAITEYFLCYDKAAVLVFAEHPARLILLADPASDFDALGELGRGFVREHGNLLQSYGPKPKPMEPQSEAQQAKVLAFEPEKKQPIRSVEQSKPAAEDRSKIMPFGDPPPPTPVVGSAVAGSRAETWLVFREKLHVLLNRVMGSGQSTRLVDRVIAEYGFGHDRPPDRDCFRNIAEDLVDHIQNRSRRRSLQASVDELLRQEKL